jgi:hypothetical protein
VISSDFCSVYASAGKKADGLVNLYCRAHIRRYFVRAGDANPDQLKYWAQAWLERIKNLYAAHGQLMGAWAQADDGRLHQARQAWDDAIGAVDEARARQMAAPGLQEPAKKALATLDREWDGLIAHREFPMIGLDNNPAERAIRRPVVTRRNAYGSRNDDAARLAARIWTVTATAEMAGLSVTTYLTAYLDARAQQRQARVGDGPRTVPALERRPGWQGSLEPAATARLTRVRPASPRKRPCEPVTPAAGIERPGSRIPSPPPLAGPRAGGIRASPQLVVGVWDR